MPGLGNMQKTTRAHDSLPYLLFEPDRDAHSDGEVPLIVFLHGSGECGDGDPSHDSLGKLESCGLPQVAAANALPLIEEGLALRVAAPQAGPEHWDPHLEDGRVLGIIDELVEEGKADPSRCYLTGLSMGATGVWKLAAREPRRFAALFPMSGSIPSEADQARAVPCWMFTGEKDQYYSIEKIERRVEELRQAGADITLTKDPDARHERGFWRKTYERPDLYRWLLSHETPSRP
jgi:predicted peptidase